jgi:hypothetical protein
MKSLEQGKVEVISEFLQVEELIDEKVVQINTNHLSIHITMKEHGRINGMTPAD